MTIRWRLTRAGFAVVLAASLLGIPGIACAGERCERRGGDYDGRGYRDGGYYRDSGNYRSQYRNRDDRDYGFRGDNYYRGYQRRSAGKSAAIIGASAAAGAVAGGLAGVGNGAAIGAAVGGIGGLIYDRATKDRRRR